jgi:hypothetical protein
VKLTFWLGLKFQNVLYNKIQGSNDDDCENCVFWDVAPYNVVEVYRCQWIVLPALSGLQKEKYSSYFIRVKSVGRMGMELLMYVMHIYIWLKMSFVISTQVCMYVCVGVSGCKNSTLSQIIIQGL